MGKISILLNVVLERAEECEEADLCMDDDNFGGGGGGRLRMAYAPSSLTANFDDL